jgi:hypothetical protein
VIGPGSAYSNRPPQPLRQGKKEIFAERVQRPFIKDVTIGQGAEVMDALARLLFHHVFPPGASNHWLLNETPDKTTSVVGEIY